MSKRTRRNAGNKNYKEADSDDESEFTLQNIALDIFRRIASRSARSPRVRTATRRKRSTTTSRSSRGRCSANASTSTSRRSRSRNLRNPSTVSIDTSQSDDGEYDERVRDRVNSHFKSTILVSDDEDIVIPPVEKPARLPDRFSKDLYVLSDSDDDVLPSTSFDRNPTSCSHTVQDTIATDIPGGPTKQDTAPTEDLTAAARTATDSNVDEILEVVDDIIECTKSPEKPPASVEDWKAKTAELLSSADALMKDLYQMTGKSPTEEPKKPVQEADAIMKECPICMDKLGGTVQAATTLCGHLFCRPCITKAAQISKKCPTCRKTINVKKIVPIYI